MNEPNSIYVSARLSAATEAAQVGDVARSTEDLDRLIRAVVPPSNLSLSEPLETTGVDPFSNNDFQTTGTTSSRLSQRSTPSAEDAAFVFGDNYFQHWRGCEPTKIILSRIRDQYGMYFREQPLRLEDHTDILILNNDGDAKITRNFLVANIGQKTILNTRDKIAFEYPPLALSVYAYDQSDGGSLKTNARPERTCFRDTDICFARPVEPLCTAAYAVEYTVRGMFRFDTFWFSRVYAGTIRQSLSIHFPAPAQIRQYRSMTELPTGEVLESSPKIRTEFGQNGTGLNWEVKFPACQSLIKTFWCL